MLYFFNIAFFLFTILKDLNLIKNLKKALTFTNNKAATATAQKNLIVIFLNVF
jgi:hypothetical protein